MKRMNLALMTAATALLVFAPDLIAGQDLGVVWGIH